MPLMTCEEQARQTDPVICIDPCRDPMWQRLIQNENSSVFHTPMWMEALARTYGWHFQSFVLTGSQGIPRGGVPFCRVDDLLGPRAVILPFSDYCDPLIQRQEDWTRMLEMLLAHGIPVSIRC